MKLMSRDKSADLTEVLSCRATLFECLRHNLLSLRQVQLACDVTSLSIAFRSIAGTGDLLSKHASRSYTFYCSFTSVKKITYTKVTEVILVSFPSV